jgi:pentalenolactone synthase
MELQLLFGQLFGRFPTLRLDAPLEQLRAKADRSAGRTVEIPVAW